jgi:hypothetical protein
MILYHSILLDITYCWQDPEAIVWVNYRSILSSERALYIKKPAIVKQKTKIWSLAPDGSMTPRQTVWLTICHNLTSTSTTTSRTTGLWTVEDHTFSRQSASCTGHALPPGRFLILISIRGWINTRAIVWLDGLGKLKTNQFISLGIEIATLWLAAQCLNQLRYCVPLVDSKCLL